MNTFPARYPGRCPCGEAFNTDDEVFYDANNTLNAVDCCGTDIHMIAPTVRATTVTGPLPHGRTTADRCNTCFQIPAANGECGCT